MDGGDLMTVLKTLEQSRFYELNLIVEGEQLHLAAPIEPPADLLDSLKENKQLIIKHLELYQDASFEIAKLVWYGHYWGCELCKNHHTQLKPAPDHPCNEGELLNSIYNNTIN